MSESESRIERWRGKLRTASTHLRRGLPFASGVLAALLAMFLYNLTVTQPEQLTVRDVKILCGSHGIRHGSAFVFLAGVSGHPSVADPCPSGARERGRGVRISAWEAV
jgi:hypothetical protein